MATLAVALAQVNKFLAYSAYANLKGARHVFAREGDDKAPKEAHGVLCLAEFEATVLGVDFPRTKLIRWCAAGDRII